MFKWFDPDWLTQDEFAIASKILGTLRDPDFIIAPNGEPYLYRWHVIPRNDRANVYFHIQVADDPERPLHDHPWDNMSVILSGGYNEQIIHNPAATLQPPLRPYYVRAMRAGDTVWRSASEAHRLTLAPGIKRTLTLFSTGPKVRTWGFWFDDGWRPWTDVIEDLPDGRSVFKGS